MNNTQLSVVLEFFMTISAAEAAVADYYTACAEAWPEEALWKELVRQELSHAAAALRMKELIAAAPADFLLPKPVNVKGVDLFTKGVSASALKVRAKAYTLKQALAISRDLEQSILEARYDQILSTKNPGYNEFVKVIMQETYGHRDRINKRLATVDIVK